MDMSVSGHAPYAVRSRTLSPDACSIGGQCHSMDNVIATSICQRPSWNEKFDSILIHIRPMSANYAQHTTRSVCPVKDFEQGSNSALFARTILTLRQKLHMHFKVFTFIDYQTSLIFRYPVDNCLVPKSREAPILMMCSHGLCCAQMVRMGHTQALNI